MEKEFSTIEEAVEDIRQGKMIVIVDDEDRENEGDLMVAAEKVTPENINFMAKFGRGLICLTLTENRTRELGLNMMVDDNQSAFETPFTVSIDARHGISTGISAADRAHTIKVAIDPEIKIIITLINFLKSLTNKAKNVKGIANDNPSFSGIIEPR